MTTKLNQQVKEFHKLVGQPIGQFPGIPDDKTVRLRGRLVIEEAFEFLESLTTDYTAGTFRRIREEVKAMIANMPVDVDLADAIDALADLDYVSEGSRVAFGVDGEPIADVVHRANMAKVAGGLDEHGKAVKPEGWKPPDIEACLQAQLVEAGHCVRCRREIYVCIDSPCETDVERAPVVHLRVGGTVYVCRRDRIRDGQLGYWQLLDLIGRGPPLAPSVTWKKRNGTGGILMPDGAVAFEEGMIFQVADTGGA